MKIMRKDCTVVQSKKEITFNQAILYYYVVIIVSIPADLLYTLVIMNNI